MFSNQNKDVKCPMGATSVCPTCLSKDRHFYMLDGALYDLPVLLEIFRKENMKQAVCWECYANLGKMLRFKNNALHAQQMFQKMKDKSKVKLISFSRLEKVTQTKVITLTSKDMQEEMQEMESLSNIPPSPSPPSSPTLTPLHFLQTSPSRKLNRKQGNKQKKNNARKPVYFLISRRKTSETKTFEISSAKKNPTKKPSKLNLLLGKVKSSIHPKTSEKELQMVATKPLKVNETINAVQYCNGYPETRHKLGKVTDVDDKTEMFPIIEVNSNETIVISESENDEIQSDDCGDESPQYLRYDSDEEWLDDSDDALSIIANDELSDRCDSPAMNRTERQQQQNNINNSNYSTSRTNQQDSEKETDDKDKIEHNLTNTNESKSQVLDHDTIQELQKQKVISGVTKIDDIEMCTDENITKQKTRKKEITPFKVHSIPNNHYQMKNFEAIAQDIQTPNSDDEMTILSLSCSTDENEKQDTNIESLTEVSETMKNILESPNDVIEFTTIDDIEICTDEIITEQETCNKITSFNLYSVPNDDHLVKNFEAIAKDIQTPNSDDGMTILSLSRSTDENEKQDTNIESLTEASIMNIIVETPNDKTELAQDHSIQEQENAIQDKESTVICVNEETTSIPQTKDNFDFEKNLSSDGTKFDDNKKCDYKNTITDIKSCIENINSEHLNVLKVTKSNTDTIKSPQKEPMHDLILQSRSDQPLNFKDDTHSESVDHDTTINDTSQKCNENSRQTLLDGINAKPQLVVTKITADMPWKHLKITQSPSLPKSPNATELVQKTLTKKNEQNIKLATLKSLKFVMKDHRYAKYSRYKLSELRENIIALDCKEEKLKISRKTYPCASLLKKQALLKATNNTGIDDLHANEVLKEDFLAENAQSQSEDEHLINDLANQNKLNHLVHDLHTNEDYLKESTEYNNTNDHLHGARTENHSENEHLNANTNDMTDEADVTPDEPKLFVNLTKVSIDLSKYFPGPPAHDEEVMSNNVRLENDTKDINGNANCSLSQCVTEEDEINVKSEPIDSETDTAPSIDDLYYKPFEFDFGENAPDFIDEDFHDDVKNTPTETLINPKMSFFSHLFTQNFTVNAHSNSNIEATEDQIDSKTSAQKTKDDSVELRDANCLLGGNEDNLTFLTNTENELLKPLYSTPFVDEPYSHMTKENKKKSQKSKPWIKTRRKPKIKEKPKAPEQRKKSETQKHGSDNHGNKFRLLRKRTIIESQEVTEEANASDNMKKDLTKNPIVKYETKYIPTKKRMKIDNLDVEKAITQNNSKDDDLSHSILELEVNHNLNENENNTNSFEAKEQNRQESNNEKYSLPLIVESNENTNSNPANSKINENQNSADKEILINFNDNMEIDLYELELPESSNQLNSNTKKKKEIKEITHQVEPTAANLSQLFLHPIVKLEKNPMIERKIRSEHNTKERNEITTTRPETNKSHEDKLTPIDFIENNKEITLEELEGEFQDDDIIPNSLDTMTEDSSPNIEFKKECNKDRHSQFSTSQSNSLYSVKTVSKDEQIIVEQMTKDDRFFKEAHFKCYACVQIFFSRNIMEKHMKHHEEGAGTFVCGKCSWRFHHRKSLNLHNNLKHKRCYKCHWCDRKYMFIHLLNTHVRHVHPKEVVRTCRNVTSKNKRCRKSKSTRMKLREQHEIEIQLEIGGEQLEIGGEQLEIDGEQFEISGEQLEISGEQLEVSGEQLEISGEQLEIGAEQLEIGAEQLVSN